MLNYNRELIKSSKNIPHLSFFKWMEASVAHQLYQKSEEALELFNQINVDDLDSELSIEIVNARGLIYYQKKEYDKALKIFYHGMEIINDDVNFKVHAKLLFNYTLTLEESNENSEALSVLLSGIELLLENDSLYLLGDFYYTKAFIYNKIDDHEEAISNLKLAQTIFKLQNNMRFYDLSTFAISKIKKQLQHTEE